MDQRVAANVFCRIPLSCWPDGEVAQHPILVRIRTSGNLRPLNLYGSIP
jgi:hypothetical protein